MTDTTETARFAVFIDKGGCGKTTTAAHLGVALDRQGLDVLLIDLAGKQGDLGKHFGVWDDYRETIDDGEAWPNVSTVFDDQWGAVAERIGPEQAVDELTVETDEGPDLIPAHPGLDSLDGDLGNVDDAADRYSRLGRFLDDYVDPLDRYDVVMIDLPGLTNNVTINGLWAAGRVVAPVEMGHFEIEQARQLRSDLESILETFDVEIGLELVLPNKVRQSTTLAEEYLETFTEEYPEAIAPEPVPISQDVRNAAEGGTTVYALDRPSETAKRAMAAFDAAARKVSDEGRVEA